MLLDSWHEIRPRYFLDESVETSVDKNVKNVDNNDNDNNDDGNNNDNSSNNKKPKDTIDYCHLLCSNLILGVFCKTFMLIVITS